jgi:hypothetical protein
MKTPMIKFAQKEPLKKIIKNKPDHNNSESLKAISLMMKDLPIIKIKNPTKNLKKALCSCKDKLFNLCSIEKNNLIFFLKLKKKLLIL